MRSKRTEDGNYKEKRLEEQRRNEGMENKETWRRGFPEIFDWLVLQWSPLMGCLEEEEEPDLRRL